jgi:hypothetical protein
MFEYLKGLFSSKEKEIVDVEKVRENTIKYIETKTHIRRITYDIKGKIIESIITKK